VIDRNLNYGVPLLLLGLLAPLPVFLLKWPSTATLEVYGILVIDVWAIAATVLTRNRVIRVR
jgi:hypothetical membrane protein